MTSDIMADIGPSAPSRQEIRRRARETIDYAKMALERCDQQDATNALKWLEKARLAASARDEVAT